MNCTKWPCNMTAGGCFDPYCPKKTVQTPGTGHPLVVPTIPSFAVQGCICPPTSEQTCKNPACPRGGGKEFTIT